VETEGIKNLTHSFSLRGPSASALLPYLPSDMNLAFRSARCSVGTFSGSGIGKNESDESVDSKEEEVPDVVTDNDVTCEFVEVELE